ncbi:MAG: SusC/RagA family TonB-linked outer membrane protein [Dysgonamonadaceae bacterium]|nr:SusC/RagA family TonB-linked outer membrane protein [Dysgonamonadaceae bacterium]
MVTRLIFYLLLMGVVQISAYGVVPSHENVLETHDVQQKTITVKGIVLDEFNEPLPGASIVIKGTQNGQAANENGEFEFTNVSPNAVLAVSFLGYQKTEIPVNGNQMLTIRMQPDSQVLSEMVVTGYQTIDRRLFTGAVATIKAEEALTDGVADVSRSLQGKAAGVQVQNISGTFGASPKLRIRGSATIYGNQKPLWIVDGVALEDVVNVSVDDLSSGNAETLIGSAIAGLNADDIETFQILKDAAASSIYGARAMNGVVVITTKKGKRGSVKLNYTGEFTSRLKPSYQNYNIMNSQEQMMVYEEMAAKGWLNYANVSRQANGGIYKKMYDLLSEWNENTGQFTLQNTPEAKAAFLQQYETINTDWFDELFKNSLQQNHSFNISGGTDRSSFYASLSYFGDSGWSVGDNVKRITGSANVSYDVNKHVTFRLLSNTSVRLQRAPGSNNRSVDVVNGTYVRDFDTNPYSYALNTSRVLRPYDNDGNLEYYTMNYAPFNILNEINSHTLDIGKSDTKLQGELEIKPIKGLSIRLLGNFNYSQSAREQKVNEKSNYAQAYRANDDSYVNDNNRYLYADPDHPALPSVVILPYGGFYNRTDNNLIHWFEKALAEYNLGLDKHLFNILLGQELSYSDRTSSFFQGWGYQWDRGGTPYLDYKAFKKMVEAGSSNYYYSYSPDYDRASSFLSRVGYSYDGKYVLNLAGRYEGSNRLGRTRQARWLPTWSLSGAWHVSDEKFMESVTPISLLNLRLSYSMNGNPPERASNALPVFYNDVIYRPTQSEIENYIYISQLENKDLTWEKLYEFNVGLDMGFLNNRISLTTDLYSRRSKDLIGRIRTSGIGGQTDKYVNYANMKAKGIEITLDTKNIVTKDFSWTTNFNFAYNKNEITKLEGFPRVWDLVLEAGYPREGYPQRSLFSIPFTGLNSDGLPTVLNENGEKVVGNINFQETLNTNYLKYEGPIDPPITGGFDNTFKYRNIRLSAYLSYAFGNVVRLDNIFRSSYNDLSAMGREFMDRWVLPGDEAHTNVPVIASLGQVNDNSKMSAAYNAYNYSTERVAKGDFIRLRDVTLSYDLPKSWMQTIGVGNIQLRAIASNLFLLYSDSKLEGQDPEFFKSGGVAMPVPKQYTFSVRIGF